MKYNFVIKTFGNILNGFVKNEVKDKEKIKNLKNEYKSIILKADDIGEKNMLITSYAFGAYFLAMNRTLGLSPKENQQILIKGIKKSRIFKLFMGNAENYLSEKRKEQRRKWAKETKLRKYKNDWVCDVVEKTNDFEFGIDYYECGICKLFKQENCFELAKYMCEIDYVLFEIIGIELIRTTTLANDGTKCDFRFKMKNQSN